jgi:murein DD-endopeptidase MepM/ murein hydrolase activator NlpD
MVRRARAALALIAAMAVLAPPAAHAYGSPGIAALQVTLRARGVYGGTIDGVRGPGTVRAVRAFQRRAGLLADGIVGRRTRAALGRFARRRLGSRPMRAGMSGWDVAALQFMLAWHGFPSGPMDGHFGPRTDRAVRRYQHWARIGADGVAGPVTLGRLRGPLPRSPVWLLRPVRAPIGDGFAPRGNRFHAGIDFTAWYGARVRAARGGRVVHAGWDPGGFGHLVVVLHRPGVRTFYGHLSRVAVRWGQRVGAGRRLGAVGASGRATGPHLHFELRVRGAAVNPLPALR